MGLSQCFTQTVHGSSSGLSFASCNCAVNSSWDVSTITGSREAEAEPRLLILAPSPSLNPAIRGGVRRQEHRVKHHSPRCITPMYAA